MEKPYLIPADDIRENPFEEKNLYKIYHDSSHPVATRVVRSKGKKPPKKPANTAFDIAFDSLYFQGVRQGLKRGCYGGLYTSGIGEALSRFFHFAKIYFGKDG